MPCVNEQLHVLPTVQGSRAVSGTVGACLYYRAYSGVCLILHACHSLYYRAYSGDVSYWQCILKPVNKFEH